MVPLTPTQAKPPGRMAQSMEQINNLQPQTPTSPSKSRKFKRQNSNKKAVSMCNLDDLDTILDTLSTTSKAKRNESTAFELLKSENKEELENAIEQAQEEGILVDLDTPDDKGEENLIDLNNGHYYPGKVYPAGYSQEAIQKVLAVQESEGKVSTADLLDICRREKQVKPPWVEDEEDRCFIGYQNINQMLEDLGVDVKKVRGFSLNIL